MSDDEKHFSADDEPVNPRAHKSLLQAISSLGKAQHIKHTTRNESAKQPDEFQLVKANYASTAAPANAVGINDLVQLLKGSGKHLEVGKKLKNVASTTKVVPVPLEKPAAERIKRTIGYDNVKKKLARWDAVVAKNRNAEHQVFPLQTETIHINTSAHSKPLRLSLKSEMQRQMEETEAQLAALRRARIGDTTDPKQQAAEEERLLAQKLTRDELLARRKELSYLKMRESQKSAKQRMQNKIKSKKYHKLLKRQKMQKQIKEFELLQQTDPEAALVKLNELEKNRVLERANLRHKNTGTWAKNLQIRAKYDKDVRKDLAEQLQISRQLTSKQHDSADELEQEEVQTKMQEEEAAIINDPFNPWTKAQANGEVAEKGADAVDEGNYRKYWMERNKNEQLLKEFKQELALVEQDDKPEEEKEEQKSKTKKTQKQNKKAKLENGWLVEEIEVSESVAESANIDDIFDAGEDQMHAQLQKKMQRLQNNAAQLSKIKSKDNKKLKRQRKEPKNELKQLDDLSFKQAAKRPLLDEALIVDGEEEQNPEERGKRLREMQSNVTKPSVRTLPEQSDVIDPTKIAPIKLKQHINSLTPLGAAAEFDDEVDDEEDAIERQLSAQQMTISEAFVDDDIVADFSRDKSEKSKPQDDELQLAMPGWGAWGGAGISKEAQANRNKRLLLKLAPVEKRRDENKTTVYINEEPSKSLRSHLVSDVPFPFTSLQDYEASIRAPIGRNFVPETAFRMLTRPAVITRKGLIIEPMDQSELVKKPVRGKSVVDRRIERAAEVKVK